MGERQIELTWRCSSCGHRNLGRHMVCQSCGNPKDASEEYEMPPDPSAAASVTDPALLRMAKAGANWACAYCGSDQRDLDGGCRRCGAGRAAGRAPSGGAHAPVAARPVPSRRFGAVHALLVAVGATLALGTCGVLVAARRGGASRAPSAPTAIAPRTDFDATVSAASWKRTVRVDRWQRVAHESFTSEVPAGAVDVRAAGQRVHHHEDVFDHEETVWDEVEVPDGFRTETYTERTRCGEDCTTTPRSCRPVCTRTPRSCRQVCTNNKNGFATCRDVCTGGEERCRDECTGGDRRCEPKYCTETRTRQIPKTRTEKRPRVVKKYRSEPRYAPWSTYETWEWAAVRAEEAEGAGVSPSWPDAGALAAGDGGGDASDGPRAGQEREVRTESFSVTLRTDDGATHTYAPTSAEELERLAPGTTLRVRIAGGRITILEAAGDAAR